MKGKAAIIILLSLLIGCGVKGQVYLFEDKMDIIDVGHSGQAP